MSRLTLKQANTIIENALTEAHNMKIKPLCVVVVDDSGNVVAAQREDQASMFRFDVALGKAWAPWRWAARAACSPSAPRTIRTSLSRWRRQARASFCRSRAQCLSRMLKARFSVQPAQAAVPATKTRLAVSMGWRKRVSPLMHQPSSLRPPRPRAASPASKSRSV